MGLVKKAIDVIKKFLAILAIIGSIGAAIFLAPFLESPTENEWRPPIERKKSLFFIA